MSLCDSCIHAWYKGIPTKEEVAQEGAKPENYPLCHALHWLNDMKTEFYAEVAARAYPITDADIAFDVADCAAYAWNGKEKPEGKLVALHGGKATVKESLTTG